MTGRGADIADQLTADELLDVLGDEPGPLPSNGGPAPVPGPEPFEIRRVLEGSAPQPPEILVDRWILHRDITVLSAKGGAAKSVAMLTSAMQIALGLPVFGTLAVRQPGPVVLVCPEDGLGAVRMMLDAIAAGLELSETQRASASERLVIVDDDEVVDLTRDCRRLRATVEKVGAVLLVLDPLRNLLPGIEETDNNVAGTTVDALRREVCRGAGAAVLLSHHVRKGKRGEDNPDEFTMDDVRGAGAWVAGARLVWLMTKSGDTLRLACGKANRLRTEDMRHELTLSIRTSPENPTQWERLELVDSNAGGGSDSYVPGVGRPINASERKALAALDDRQEPGLRHSFSSWRRASGIPEGSWGGVRQRLLAAQLVHNESTGKKGRNGATEYTYSITEAGRRALDTGFSADLQGMGG